MLDVPKYPYSLIDRKDYLLEILRVPDPTIFEIGCNDGLDSAKLLRIFPGATLHCFEPDPRAIQEFKDSGVNATLHEMALGVAESEKGTFFQSSGTKRGAYKKDWNLSGSLNNPTGHRKFSPWIQFNRVIEVQVRTLDSVVAELLTKSIHLMWIDAQGGEQNVFRGGRESLAITKYVYTEFGHWKEPLYDGQMTLEETVTELGEGWRPIAVYDSCNILLKNDKL